MTDLEIYKDWLLKALAKYPDPNIANNTELVIDGYDVVTEMEYPAAERLVAGASEAYDVVMLTGSSKSRGSLSDGQSIPPTIQRAPSLHV